MLHIFSLVSFLAFSARLFHQGLIEFKNMSLYYDVNTAPALKNLSMTIEPGMKVGIVGRFVAIISFRNLSFFSADADDDFPGWEKTWSAFSFKLKLRGGGSLWIVSSDEFT